MDVYSKADSRGVLAAAAAARITSTPLHQFVMEKELKSGNAARTD
jgi:hypothetical protein